MGNDERTTSERVNEGVDEHRLNLARAGDASKPQARFPSIARRFSASSISAPLDTQATLTVTQGAILTTLIAASFT